MGDGLASAPAKAEKLQLDDVMLAMDVVDTLRHRQRIVERELGSESREQELIERLREIYGAQGIEVPDHILEDGVRALDEQRFVYTPPRDSVAVRLARIYVARGRWAKRLAILLLLLAGILGAWHLGWQRPRQQRLAAYEQRMHVTLPAELDQLRDACLELAANEDVERPLRALYEEGTAALVSDDVAEAEDVLARFKGLHGLLRSEYAVRIVSRAGEGSGVWRVPEEHPQARNYYLIVEAVDSKGKVVPVRITSEEDQRTSIARKWGLRVDEQTFERVRDDKLDDGIIQAGRVGQKPRGFLEHTYTIETDGGAILDW